MCYTTTQNVLDKLSVRVLGYSLNLWIHNSMCLYLLSLRLEVSVQVEDTSYPQLKWVVTNSSSEFFFTWRKKDVEGYSIRTSIKILVLFTLSITLFV